MAIYSFDQIKAIALTAGFDDYNSVIAAAVALAESSGNSDAIGDLNLPNAGPSYGLWQINSVHNGAEKAIDPAIGAHMAYQVSNGGTNWRPWTTYRTGAYRRHLPADFVESGDTGARTAPPVKSKPPSSVQPSHVGTTAGITGALTIVIGWLLHWPMTAPTTEQAAAIAALLVGASAAAGVKWMQK